MGDGGKGDPSEGPGVAGCGTRLRVSRVLVERVAEEGFGASLCSPEVLNKDEALFAASGACEVPEAPPLDDGGLSGSSLSLPLRAPKEIRDTFLTIVLCRWPWPPVEGEPSVCPSRWTDDKSMLGR